MTKDMFGESLKKNKKYPNYQSIFHFDFKNKIHSFKNF